VAELIGEKEVPRFQVIGMPLRFSAQLQTETLTGSVLMARRYGKALNGR
jgi:hypothetical protein